MKTIYFVGKVNSKKNITHIFGAFNSKDKANKICEELNENISGVTYIVEPTTLD